MPVSSYATASTFSKELSNDLLFSDLQITGNLLQDPAERPNFQGSVCRDGYVMFLSFER